MADSSATACGQLSLYLNDHLAGSVAAIELIEHLLATSAGGDLTGFLQKLRAEIRDDQQVLRDLLGELGADESAVRKAGAWLMEKFGRAKLGLAQSDARGIGLLEALEALVLGITGKQLLWRSLTATVSTLPAFRGRDFAELEQRAAHQRDQVERHRLAAAREAFRAVSRQN